MRRSLCGSITRGLIEPFSQTARNALSKWCGIVSSPLCWTMLAFVFAVTPVSSVAQEQTTLVSVGGNFLPDSPSPQSDAQSSNGESTSQEGTASVSGTVLDPTGAAVPGAQVTLMLRDGTTVRALASGPHGEFIFTELSAGFYFVMIKASGFAPFTSSGFSLAERQNYELPGIALSLAGASTDVVVRPADVMAAEQIKEEEKQRLLGILPDFYVSYVWDAAPLNARQKYSMELRDILDPTTFIGVSIGAGIQQARNSYLGFGQGAEGYGKRWGSLFANGRTSDLFSRAVFPSMFHQDPRYFYEGSAGSNWSRTKHAISYAFVARSDSGHLMPNYSLFLGNVCAGALSNVYYPDSSRGADLIFENAALSLSGRIAQNMAHEFLFKHLTKHLPGNGKPSNVAKNP